MLFFNGTLYQEKKKVELFKRFFFSWYKTRKEPSLQQPSARQGILQFPTIAPCCSDAQKARAAGASQHTQGGNAFLFDGGKSGGHRRADNACSAERAPSFY